MGFHVKCSICGYVDSITRREYIENIIKPKNIVGSMQCENCKCMAVVKKEHLINDEESEW